MGLTNTVFILDDGTTITSLELSKKLDCPKSTAYARLAKTTDPKKIYKKVNHCEKGGRTYTLDDGSQWNSRTLAEYIGIGISTASSRLSLHSDPKKVLAPAKVKKPKEKTVDKIIKERMYFDPLGHWGIINKNLKPVRI